MGGEDHCCSTCCYVHPLLSQLCTAQLLLAKENSERVDQKQKCKNAKAVNRSLLITVPLCDCPVTFYSLGSKPKFHLIIWGRSSVSSCRRDANRATERKNSWKRSLREINRSWKVERQSCNSSSQLLTHSPTQSESAVDHPENFPPYNWDSRRAYNGGCNDDFADDEIFEVFGQMQKLIELVSADRQLSCSL